MDGRTNKASYRDMWTHIKKRYVSSRDRIKRFLDASTHLFKRRPSVGQAFFKYRGNEDFNGTGDLFLKSDHIKNIDSIHEMDFKKVINIFFT